jgi:hypothetical protein
MDGNGLVEVADRLVVLAVLPALPGATHDLAAARMHDLIDALTASRVLTFADKGYQGAGGSVVTALNATADDHGYRR